MVLDEVLGRANFVGEIIWRAADSSNNDAKQFSVDHNTILIYSKEPGWRSIALPRSEEDNAHYSNPDNDPRGDWFSGNVSSPNPRENLRFVIDESFGWGGTPINPPANGNGIGQGSGPQFASVVTGVPLYEHHPVAGVTQPGTLQWLNPAAFVSAVDPSTGQCVGGDDPQHCQFGNLGRNALRGPDFVWNDFYLTKWFPVSERVKLRVEGQFFNVFNHPNFGLPSMTLAGIPGNPSTQTGFGALTYATSPPTGLLGVGLGGDSSPRMVAFQTRLEF